MMKRTHTDREYSARLEALREGLLLMAGHVAAGSAGDVTGRGAR
jgi:hypothetical protein